jgi:hypothetical protein
VEFPKICNTIGHPVLLDAARLGAITGPANLAHPSQLAAALALVQRPPGLLAKEVLKAGRHLQLAKYTDHAPWYECNRQGVELAACSVNGEKPLVGDVSVASQLASAMLHATTPPSLNCARARALLFVSYS